MVELEDFFLVNIAKFIILQKVSQRLDDFNSYANIHLKLSAF